VAFRLFHNHLPTQSGPACWGRKPWIRRADNVYALAPYDELGPVRKQYGVTAASVHRDPKDPNTVIVTQQFRDLNAATSFANSTDLKSAMAKAGVSGPPEFWFSEDVEHTPY
jgi:quinol monooxygenase YgiN